MQTLDTPRPLVDAGTMPDVDPLALLDELAARGVVSAAARDQARSLYSQTALHPLSGLLRLNAVSERTLYEEAAKALGVPLFELSTAVDAGETARGLQADATALGLTWSWLLAKGLVLARDAGGWIVAMRESISADAANLILRKAAAQAMAVRWMLLPPSVFARVSALIEQHGREQAMPAGADDLRALRELAEEGPTIELLNGVLSRAVTQRASDIHFEAEEFEFWVRVRVDGQMLELTRQPRAKFDALACRIKILAELDIAERRLAQDGRINARVNGEAFDIRVSVLPAAYGESIALRLLRQERKPTRLDDLGMSSEQAAAFTRWVRLDNGIVLVTGPTGSGKSTTLYTALELANDRSQKIITIEDPVEYKLPGLTQLQVNAEIGFTFAAALRSILRHDPDLILVGEIRDEETARIAIQSALTGHLVLSTLHTNSAIGAVTRLLDMGVESYLIAASLRGLMAQRLVRRLCRHCRAEDRSMDEALTALFERFGLLERARPCRPVGCAECSGTGYLGRFAIYDLIEVTPELAHLTAAAAGESDLRAALPESQRDGLLRSGVAWIAQGETSLGEVLRAAGGG